VEYGPVRLHTVPRHGKLCGCFIQTVKIWLLLIFFVVLLELLSDQQEKKNGANSEK